MYTPTQQSTKRTQSSLSSFSPLHITSVVLLLFHGREQSSKSRLVCSAQTCWQLHTYSFITHHSLQQLRPGLCICLCSLRVCLCDISGAVSVDVLYVCVFLSLMVCMWRVYGMCYDSRCVWHKHSALWWRSVILGGLSSGLEVYIHNPRFDVLLWTHDFVM